MARDEAIQRDTASFGLADPLPPVLRVKFKLHPKVPALTELGRHLKLFTDKVEVETVPENPERRDASIRLMLALLEEKARGRLPQSISAALSELARTGRPTVDPTPREQHGADYLLPSLRPLPRHATRF